MTDHDDMSEPVDADAESPLEPWLQLLADGYHRPPPAPREAMWARIQAARAVAADPHEAAGSGDAVVVAGAGALRAAELAAGPAPGLAIGSAAGDALARRRAARGGNAGANPRGLAVWPGPWLGLAAAVLLAAGLGWWTRTTGAPAAGVPAVPDAVAVLPPDSSTTATPARTPPSTPARTTAPAATSVGVPTPRPTVATVTPRATPADRSPASASPAGGRLVASASAGRGDDPTADGTGANAPYRLAAAQHLGQAEALLTVFRAESTRDAADPSLQQWARELLTTTRLLLDSPAARDPRLGELLDELEPVLVQIVQLPAARMAEERQLIARSLERSDLLTQLRSVVPAGPVVPQRAGE